MRIDDIVYEDADGGKPPPSSPGPSRYQIDELMSVIGIQLIEQLALGSRHEDRNPHRAHHCNMSRSHDPFSVGGGRPRRSPLMKKARTIPTTNRAMPVAPPVAKTSSVIDRRHGHQQPAIGRGHGPLSTNTRRLMAPGCPSPHRVDLLIEVYGIMAAPDPNEQKVGRYGGTCLAAERRLPMPQSASARRRR